MLLTALTAGFVGFVHSLSPAHWIPVALMARARKWSRATAFLAALVTASGHVLVSIALGLLGVVIELRFLTEYEEVIEKYSGLVLIVFGLGFATYSLWTHHSCHGHHHHHGPNPRPGSRKHPFLFLFFLGFSPCIAALPLFLAAVPQGPTSIIFTLAAFSMGVILALSFSTLLVTLGLMKLDHPLFEHYGDVITGAAIAGLGAWVFLSGGH